MRNGYYISAYCSIDPLGNVLNTGLRHDQNIALWHLDGNKLTLCHHWELERITGIKHHMPAFYSENDFYLFLDKILKEYDLCIDNIAGIIGMKGTKKNIMDDIDLENNELSYHSLCHLFASMLTDSEKFYHENIIGLSLDAGPDFDLEKDVKLKKYYTGVYSVKGQCEFFPISSPGVLWSTVADCFHKPEGTLMALAYASKSESYSNYESIEIMKREDTINARVYVQKIINDIMSYTTEDAGTKYNYYDEHFSEEDNKISMVMKIIQKMSVEMVETTINKIVEKYKIDTTNTCIALGGGYSLNCPTNTHISHKYNFKEQLMIPCINDSGQAIGMGLKYFYEHIEKIYFKFDNAFYGNNLGKIDESFEAYIENVSYGYDKFVDDVQGAPIVWVSGRSEVGPRALGHRSIIADPKQNKAKDLLNIIKQREWWRPVAPLVLESECISWFEKSFSSPYMLNNFVVKAEKKELIPAILHLDDTARVQTVNETNNNLYKVLCQFYKATNVPILCNTSLNDKGEPIIDNINQAINFALRKKISVIYFENQRVQLKNFEQYKMEKPLPRWDELFTKYSKNESICKEINPYGLLNDEYYLYKTIPELNVLDVTNAEEMKILKRMLDKMDMLYQVRF